MPSYHNLKMRKSCLPPTKQSLHIDVTIDGHYESKIYTTGSVVQGSVRLISQHQTTFQSIHIDLRGTTSTRQPYQYTTPFISRAFMHIQMPISEEALPADHVLESGRFYDIPFLFEIPEHLTLKACNHQNEVVRERHLLLPPSLGSWMKNDLTGGSTSIDYVIRARLVLGKDGNGKEKFIDHNISLKIISLFPEQPPINVASINSQYCLSQAKTIRRRLVGTKEGVLKVSTTQPGPITLYLDHLQPSDSQLAIDLEYISSSPKCTPPDICIKGAVIETTTSFWLGPVGHLPDHDEALSNTISPVAPWTTCHAIKLQEISELKWEKVTNVGISESSLYKASMTQTLVLPTEKSLFLPTFHSCIVSRFYRVRVTLTTKAHGTAFSLVVPLQITSEGLATAYSHKLPDYYYNESEPSSDSPPPYSR